MDLADFVQTTLQEIIKGVAGAQQQLGKPDERKGIVNPLVLYQADYAPKGKYYFSNGGRLVHLVQFDVAVTTESGDKLSGGGKISVLGIGIGSEASTASKDTTASRIKFEVPITLPPGDE